MSDSFSSNLHHKACKLFNNKTTIQFPSGLAKCAFLQNVVSSGVHKWTFKIKANNDDGMYMGVWKVKHTIPSSFYNILQTKGQSYAFCMSHAYLSKGDEGDGGHGQDSWGSRVKVGDTITMILNIDKQHISYIVNGDKKLGTAFLNIEKTSYRAAVGSFGIATYELISYSANKKYKQNNDDNKCNQCDQFKSEISRLKKEKREYEEITNDFQRKIIELETDKKKYKSIREQSVVDINSLKNEIKSLQRENKEVNESNAKLNEECKELEISLNEITTKYDKLYRKQNINEHNYLEWDHDNVTDWIIGLNQEFEIYEEILRNTLKEEQVDGSILSELDKNDIHRFGIKPIKHKIQIIKEIQRITNPNKKKQSYPAAMPGNDEGNNVAPTAYI